jgi:hypothetical protein
MVSIGACVLDRAHREAAESTVTNHVTFSPCLTHFFRLRRSPSIGEAVGKDLGKWYGSRQFVPSSTHHHLLIKQNKKWPHEQPVTFPPSFAPASGLRNSRLCVPSFTHSPPPCSSSNRSSSLSLRAVIRSVPGQFSFRLRVLLTRLPSEDATVNSYRTYDARLLPGQGGMVILHWKLLTNL